MTTNVIVPGQLLHHALLLLCTETKEESATLYCQNSKPQKPRPLDSVL